MESPGVPHLAHDNLSFFAASLVFLLTESGILAVVSFLILHPNQSSFPSHESSHFCRRKHHRLLLVVCTLHPLFYI